MARLVSAISAGEILGESGRRALNVGERVLDYRLVGKATGFRIVEQTDGKQSIALRGQFAAINLETGEEVISGEAFPPTAVAKLLRSQFDSMDPNNKQTLDIGIDVGREGCTVKDSPTGYTWFVQSIEPEEFKASELGKKLHAKPLPSRQLPLIEAKPNKAK